MYCNIRLFSKCIKIHGSMDSKSNWPILTHKFEEWNIL